MTADSPRRYISSRLSVIKRRIGMGIVKAIAKAIGGGLSDQWLDIIEAGKMGDTTVLSVGRKAGETDGKDSGRGNDDIISDGSLIHVGPNMFMILTDGGRVVDYTAEEGYYKVSMDTEPSLFNGDFGDALRETFERIKYSGTAPGKQKAYFINLQEIKGIKFGTRTPISYFDSFYNAELFLRAHGTYSIKITDPLLFFREAIPKNDEDVDIDDINEQYLNEFMDALQAAVNRMSADGVRVSYVQSKSRELSSYMADILDEDWKKQRGMEICSVGIAAISYDEQSAELINMRNRGAMLCDPSVREGYVQGSLARGLEAAGSNDSGSVAGFMGMGAGMGASGGFMRAVSEANSAMMDKDGAGTWRCACGRVNSGNFCSQCGSRKPEEIKKDMWVCACGRVNDGNFCPNCGSKRPLGAVCSKCGYKWDGNGDRPKFCPQCGNSMI